MLFVLIYWGNLSLVKTPFCLPTVRGKMLHSSYEKLNLLYGLQHWNGFVKEKPWRSPSFARVADRCGLPIRPSIVHFLCAERFRPELPGEHTPPRRGLCWHLNELAAVLGECYVANPLRQGRVAVEVQSIRHHAVGASEDLGQLGLRSARYDYSLFFCHFIWICSEKYLYLGRETLFQRCKDKIL